MYCKWSHHCIASIYRNYDCDMCVFVFARFCFYYICYVFLLCMFLLHLCFCTLCFAALPPLVLVLTVSCVLCELWVVCRCICWILFLLFFLYICVFLYFAPYTVFCGAPSFGNCIDRQGSCDMCLCICMILFLYICNVFYHVCVCVFLCLRFCTLYFAALPPLVIVLTGKAAPVGLVICVILTKFSPNQGKRPDNWMTGNSRSSLN